MGHIGYTRHDTGRVTWLLIALVVLMLRSGAGQQVTAQTGTPLMGTLEGPTVITDPAQFPQTMKEPPNLAAQVQQKKLPPVQERVSADPLVIKPLHEVGKYGGTWRRGFSGPADFWNGYRCCGHDKILFWDYTGNVAVPNVAKGWEISDDGRIFTVLLRKGMKWSDGHSFTADDFMFWYEDIYQSTTTADDFMFWYEDIYQSTTSPSGPIFSLPPIRNSPMPTVH